MSNRALFFSGFALIACLAKMGSAAVIWDTDTFPNEPIFDIYTALNVNEGNPNSPRIHVQPLVGGSGTQSIIEAKMVVGGLLYKFPTIAQVTIDDLATQFGYDHFNWINLMTMDPSRQLMTEFPIINPFFDPLPGQPSPYPGAPVTLFPSDSQVFYWDEGAPASYVYGIKYQTKDIPVAQGGRFVRFQDEPTFPYRSQFPGTYDKFITSLVGVYGPGHPGPANFDILYSFSWQTNYDGLIGGVSVGSTRNLEPTSGGTGGVSGITLGVDINDLPNEIKQLYINAGAGNVTISPAAVPEPGTLVLAGMGCLGLVAGELRRRRKRCAA